MRRIFDHIDLRVRDLPGCVPFYRTLLPLLGFREKIEIEGWLQFEAWGEGPSEFFGVTEDPEHLPNRSRIAFRADSRNQVDEFARELADLGAMNIEGPGEESPDYYAVYFEDPSGNPLEICHRSRRFSESGGD